MSDKGLKYETSWLHYRTVILLYTEKNLRYNWTTENILLVLKNFKSYLVENKALYKMYNEKVIIQTITNWIPCKKSG